MVIAARLTLALWSACGSAVKSSVPLAMGAGPVINQCGKHGSRRSSH